MKKKYIGSIGVIVIAFLITFYTQDSPERNLLHVKKEIVTNTERSNQNPDHLVISAATIDEGQGVFAPEHYPNSPILNNEDNIAQLSDGTMIELLDEVSNSANLTEAESRLFKQVLEFKFKEDQQIMDRIKSISNKEGDLKLLSTAPANLSRDAVAKRNELLVQLELELENFSENRVVFEDAISNSLPLEKIKSVEEYSISKVTRERNRDMSSFSDYILEQNIGLSETQNRDVTALVESHISAPAGEDIPYGLAFGDSTILRSSPEFIALTQPFINELMSILRPEQLSALN